MSNTLVMQTATDSDSSARAPEHLLASIADATFSAPADRLRDTLSFLLDRLRNSMQDGEKFYRCLKVEALWIYSWAKFDDTPEYLVGELPVAAWASIAEACAAGRPYELMAATSMASSVVAVPIRFRSVHWYGLSCVNPRS